MKEGCKLLLSRFGDDPKRLFIIIVKNATFNRTLILNKNENIL
jgi:hypothetical protein